MLHIDISFDEYVIDLIKASVVAPLPPPFGINYVFPLIGHAPVTLVDHNLRFRPILLQQQLPDYLVLLGRAQLATVFTAERVCVLL
jgi:hypothetical protein